MGTDLDKKLGAADVEERKQLPRSLKIITTLAIFYGNVTYGCAMNAFSPALTDFKNKYDTDTSTISVVFSVSIGAYMCGALLCSVIYNVVNRQLTVVLLFIGMAATMIVAPHIPNLGLFYLVGGISGFCQGCYDVAQVVWIMEMWQADSGPYIQAQHFFFSVGSVISPSIMSPFLTQEDENDEDSSITTTTQENKGKNSRLFVPFTILGCICAVTAVAQLLLFIFMRYRPPPPEAAVEAARKNEDNNRDNENQAIERKPRNALVEWVLKQWPGWPVARLVILSALAIGFDQGMEMSTMQLFPTFGQNSDVQLSESAAADTLTGMTIAFMIARGASIILIFKIPPLVLLSGNLLLVLAGNILLIIWGNTSKSIIWAAGILYGLGFSSLLPSFCAYMERYLEFTNTIGALMIVTGSFIGAMYPLIIGSSIDYHPLVLCYPIFFSLAIIITAVALAYSILRKSKNRAGE